MKTSPSNFQLQVLMLDSDNLPLVNPETLFESKGYKKHGNLFWPDYWDAIQGNQPGWLTDSAYTLFGLNPPWQEDPSGFATTETGQILINRCAHSLFLSLTCHLAWLSRSPKCRSA